MKVSVMHKFKQLQVWQLSIQLCKSIYEVTRSFPGDEKYGLISQMKRACVSIPSNIAEGCGRRSDKELSHFLTISLGSSFELETQLLLAGEFNYIDEVTVNGINEQLLNIQRMLQGLRNTLN